MRSIGLQLALAALVFAAACSGDRALAPTTGHADQLSDLPPELFAAYTRTNLPGSETVVALNDSGDVVGATASGGILWHGAAHERTTLPIVPAAIANDGTVAGSIDGHAATWKRGHVTILDTAASMASAICRCESATVVGSVQVNGITHAAIWVDGIRIDAGVPPNSKHAEFSAIGGGFIVGNAIVRAPDPQFGDSSDFQQPFSWTPAGGWLPFSTYPSSIARIVSLNARGMAVGWGFCFCNHVNSEEIFYNVAARTAEAEPSSPPILDISPTGINDSAQISEDAFFAPDNGPLEPIALANERVLPPGVPGDRTAGINSAGIIAGNSDGSAVLWTPNP
ncbi:MAG: hypothetical protein H0U66_02945 [Gemmatimonadaceae bacterium]|nr:hypothetical protein [Gemmatimonadaceae bacterium]